jgi:ubiquinone/menaquinone biosynthesis C-methylase UbiE
MWNKALQDMPSKNDKKRWDKIASKFNEWMKTDDYPQNFADKVHKEPKYTVLDLGCGNGSITLKVAKEVEHVTAVDMSEEMLKLVEKNAEKEGISNISYVQSTVEDLEPERIGQHDVVIASRSLGNIYNLKDELKKIDSIARKYVYMTIWGANGRRFERELCDTMGVEYHQHPDYIYVCNMLYQMGIYANVEMLDCQSRPVYSDLEDAMDRCKWKLGWNLKEIKSEDLEKLEKFLKESAVQKEDGTLDYPTNNPDWVMIWWKKEDSG